jgi:putative RNA 2'-phosphotransferase
MSIDYRRLSKTVAHALRHAPEQYGLTLDDAGWVAVEDLLAALRSRRRAWRDLTEQDLSTMIERSTKRRYELCDSKIRAYYGHSVPERIQKNPAVPPDVLYHGTAPETVEAIMKDGLMPMSRQYVHLSTDVQTAHQVGGRKAGSPVILEIRAVDAHRAGVAFYLGNDDVWLSEQIPPQFIKAP